MHSFLVFWIINHLFFIDEADSIGWSDSIKIQIWQQSEISYEIRVFEEIGHMVLWKLRDFYHVSVAYSFLRGSCIITVILLKIHVEFQVIIIILHGNFIFKRFYFLYQKNIDWSTSYIISTSLRLVLFTVMSSKDKIISIHFWRVIKFIYHEFAMHINERAIRKMHFL